MYVYKIKTRLPIAIAIAIARMKHYIIFARGLICLSTKLILPGVATADDESRQRVDGSGTDTILAHTRWLFSATC